MADHSIRDHRSLQIAHHLKNFNHHTIGFLLFEAERFDLRIDQPPLPGPVRAHRLRPVHRAAFQPVGPFDLRPFWVERVTGLPNRLPSCF